MSMLKTFLKRFIGRAEIPDGSDEFELNPLTVFAAEPEPRPADTIEVDYLFLPWLLGTGEAAAQDLNDEENRLLRALKREADSDNPSTADLVPRIPSVIPLLLRSLRDSTVSNSQLAEQISQDAVLVAAVLKQVNSSYFRRATAVKTIEEAIAVIGQNGLRMLVASVAFKPLFNAGLGYFTTLGAPRLWELSELHGVTVRHFSKRHNVDGFALFLAGMLQNVGVIVALRVMDQAGCTAPWELRSLAFHTAFIHYARRLAGVVGKHWEFPEAALAAIDKEAGTAQTPLSQALWLADRTAKIRTLVLHGILQEEHAQACLADEEVAACYREILAAEDAREMT